MLPFTGERSDLWAFIAQVTATIAPGYRFDPEDLDAPLASWRNWRGRRATARLATCHLTAAVAVLAALVAHTGRPWTPDRHPPCGSRWRSADSSWPA